MIPLTFLYDEYIDRPKFTEQKKNPFEYIVPSPTSGVGTRKVTLKSSYPLVTVPISSHNWVLHHFMRYRTVHFIREVTCINTSTTSQHSIDRRDQHLNTTLFSLVIKTLNSFLWKLKFNKHSWQIARK